MIIYKSERENGLETVIKEKTSFAYESQLVIPEKKTSLVTAAEMQKYTKAGVNLDDEDLFYLDSVLVSVGVNKNDDVFLPEEVWEHRHTPVHKQFNFNHNQRDIIGHMFASHAFDYDGNIIADDSPFDDVPEQFDIVVSSVLYRNWPQEDLQERMDEIIDGISNGEWYVSMECMFRNFDYGLIDKNGKMQVVSRNKSTAFMTQFLRAYGGSGEYDNKRITRILRKFSFSGKGLVSNPANERSVIFNNIERLKSYSLAAEKGEDKHMSDATNKTADVTRLENELAKANDALESLRKEMADKAKAEAEAIAKAHEEALAKANETVQEKDEAIAKLNEQIKSITEKAGEVGKELEATKASLDELKAENLKNARVNKLVHAGVKDGVEDIVEKWSTASDEQFDAVVELYKATVSAATSTNQQEETDTNQAAEEAEAAIEENQVEENEGEAALASAGDDESEDERLIAAASNWLSNDVLKSKRGE